jgi:hypothetical protein
MDAKELLRLNVPKLREEALKVPDAVGVTGMKKEALIQFLAKHHNIILEQRGGGEEKAELKKRIRGLKAKRDEALTREAYKEVASLRRGIRALKRRTRILARTTKTQTAAVAPEVKA